MPDYKQGKIYKLWSPHGDEIYIGSTTQSLAKRKYKHKEMRDRCCSKLLFEKYDDVRIELIEEFACENKMELDRREGEHIRNNTCINKYIAGRTQKEYYEENKEKILEQKKEYKQNNKEKILEYQKDYYEHNKEQKKEYYENNKEKIKEYNEKNKEKIKNKKKEYYENNKEKRKEQMKEYYENNKEKIKQQIKEYHKEYNEKKFTCECGSEVRRDYLTKHKRTTKHINFINQ